MVKKHGGIDKRKWWRQRDTIPMTWSIALFLLKFYSIPGSRFPSQTETGGKKINFFLPSLKTNKQIVMNDRMGISTVYGLPYLCPWPQSQCPVFSVLPCSPRRWRWQIQTGNSSGSSPSCSPGHPCRLSIIQHTDYTAVSNSALF